MRRNRPSPRGRTSTASAKDHLPVARRRMLREPSGRVRYLTDERIADPAIRFLTACLFRWWGIGLTKEARYHVVRGLAETAGSRDWEDAARWVARGTYDLDLWDWTDHERFLAADERERADWPGWNRQLFAHLSLTYDDVKEALDRLNRQEEGRAALEQLRADCQDAPRRQGEDARTVSYKETRQSCDGIKDQRRGIYKALWRYLLPRASR